MNSQFTATTTQPAKRDDAMELAELIVAYFQPAKCARKSDAETVAEIIRNHAEKSTTEARRLALLILSRIADSNLRGCIVHQEAIQLANLLIPDRQALAKAKGASK